MKVFHNLFFPVPWIHTYLPLTTFFVRPPPNFTNSTVS